MKELELKPWHQQPGEDAKSYRYFCAYLDQMGRRAIARLAQKLNVARNTLEKRSAKFKWVERCEEWDKHVLKKLADMAEADVVEMRERHIQVGVGFQTAVVRELQALVNKINKAADDARARAIAEGRDPNKAFHEPVLSPTDLVRLSQHGVELERLTRGLVTSRAETVTETDLSALTLEELKVFKELTLKIK